MGTQIRGLTSRCMQCSLWLHFMMRSRDDCPRWQDTIWKRQREGQTKVIKRGWVSLCWSLHVSYFYKQPRGWAASMCYGAWSCMKLSLCCDLDMAIVDANVRGGGGAQAMDWVALTWKGYGLVCLCVYMKYTTRNIISPLQSGFWHICKTKLLCTGFRNLRIDTKLIHYQNQNFWIFQF